MLEVAGRIPASIAAPRNKPRPGSQTPPLPQPPWLAQAMSPEQRHRDSLAGLRRKARGRRSGLVLQSPSLPPSALSLPVEAVSNRGSSLDYLLAMSWGPSLGGFSLGDTYQGLPQAQGPRKRGQPS